MSRPLLCKGGYGNPLRAGVFKVIQIRAAVDNPTRFTRLQLVDDENLNYPADDWGTIYADKTDELKFLCDEKKMAGDGSNIVVNLQRHPLKVSRGISALKTENVEAGSIMVYVE